MFFNIHIVEFSQSLRLAISRFYIIIYFLVGNLVGDGLACPDHFNRNGLMYSIPITIRHVICISKVSPVTSEIRGFIITNAQRNPSPKLFSFSNISKFNNHIVLNNLSLNSCHYFIVRWPASQHYITNPSIHIGWICWEELHRLVGVIAVFISRRWEVTIN